jgi:hypothetical protein
MKNTFLIFFSMLLIAKATAQDVRFYQQTVNDFTTQTSVISVYAYSVGPLNNMRGFDLQFYYDGTKATFNSVNSTAVTGAGGLNFGAAGQSFTTLTQTNSNVPIVHNTLFTYLINDQVAPLTGANIPAFPGVLLMEINFINVSNVLPNDGYLSSTAQSPGMVYTDLNIDEFPVIVTGAQAQSLPIELTSMKATPVEKAIQVDWSSKSEVNFSHFELERSTNGRNFQFVTKVAGLGRSSNEYAYTDTQVEPGIIYYYRLKMADKDGQYKYSNIVQAKVEGRRLAIVQVAPNPTISDVNITFDIPEDEDVTIRVIDVNGKLMETQSYLAMSGNNIHTLDLTSYSVGMYWIEISDRTQRVTHKIIKSE